MSSSRRQFLQAASTLAAMSPLSAALAQGSRRRCSLRIAHFTDTHIKADGPSANWLARAMQHAQEQTDKPDVIMFGGDCIFDGLASPEASVKAQWRQFMSVVNDNAQVPVEYCLGNHDIFGWSSQSVSKSAPLYGKNWAKDQFGWNRTYRSFDRRGWHFVVLDSMQYRRGSYLAKLDDEQFEWLSDDLAANRSKPTIIFSHIPIVAACPMWFGESEKDGYNWRVPAWLMHIDSRRFKNLFLANTQVNVCVSGHIHLLDRVEYNNVSYLCNGSVCGSWWNGPFQETKPGYAMLHLFSDGTFHRKYTEYGWNA